MYFSNIANEEIQHFHRIIGADFSMSLTDILTSNLFKVETVIEDEIYRVYPLFYCEKVISNNVNDKLLDNRCLILQKTDQETYLSFITNFSSDNIILNENILNIKDIGDNLTLEEYNDLVYRLRQTGNLQGSLNFEENNTITGIYATYQFDNVEEQLRNDKGIIVNNKVKNNPLTVKLINPFFLNARYTLTFTVFSISGANVCEENKEDLITEDIFSINLVEGSNIVVPLTDYVNDSVLDFDVSVSISFDVPEIVNSNFELELTSDLDNILVDEDITLTATLIGENNVTGYVVEFYEDNILIGTKTTDSSGKSVLNYSPNTVSNHMYSATVLGLTSEVNVIVNKITPTITLETNANKLIEGESFTLSGILSIGAGKIVEIYKGDNLLDSTITDENGAFTKTITGAADVYNCKAVFQGDNKHNKTISNQVTSFIVASDDYIECTVVGNRLREYVGGSHGFYNSDGKNVIFDYGDGTIEVNDMYRHDYADGLNQHTMKIYNVTDLRGNCFNRCPVSYIKFNNIGTIRGIYYCNNLISVEIPDGVTNLSGIKNCPNLTNINIPSTVISLSDSCFSEDSSLTSLNIPRSVKSIGMLCFYGCSSLEVIYFNWENDDEILNYVSNWFNYTSSNLKFSIPQGTRQLYVSKGYPSSKLIERSD